MFIHFAPQQPGTTMTTMALGEEGGQRPGGVSATTMALGEEGGQGPGTTVTTLALGEEGGQNPGGGNVTTFALGEEGGQMPGGGTVTTLALGEEGGQMPGGTVTTMALGEEGGGLPPWSPQPNSVRNTNSLIGLLNRIDDQYGDKDGLLTKAETDKGLQELQKTLAELEQIRFIQYDPAHEAKLRQARLDVEMSKFLKANFDKLAAQDGTAGSLSGNEISTAAGKDGNPVTVSNKDLFKLGQPQAPPQTPPPPQTVMQMMQQAMMLMQYMMAMLGQMGYGRR